MAHARAEIGTDHYAVRIETAGHELVSDEPSARGGANAGPSPYHLLTSSLAACTAITLRMYADRKQWNLNRASVDVQYVRDGESERIERKLRLDGDLGSSASAWPTLPSARRSR